MTTTAYYCPGCGWTTDVDSHDTTPDCINCNSAMVFLLPPPIARKGRRTAAVVAPAQDCNQRPNPFYRQGEG